MFGKRLKLLSLLGFEIRFDLTWLILVALIVWTLSVGYFPTTYQDLPTGTYVWMAIVGAVGLFASLILHELSHSLVARRLGLHISGITLFMFGGAAEMTEEPKSARDEFLIAVAGPAMSVVLGLVFYLLSTGLAAIGSPEPLVGVFTYLAGINIILAAFNMVPAFPLDGGRVLRAGLWYWKGDLASATRVASMIGGGLGLLLVLMGVLNVLRGDFVGGMWWFLIGLFLRAAAAQSYQQLVARRVLQDQPVRRFMCRDPVSVPPDLPVSSLTEDYLLGRYLKQVPVVEGGRPRGWVGVREVRTLSPQDRDGKRTGDIMVPSTEEMTIGPDADAAEALQQMQRTGYSRLMVTEGGLLVGVVALKDLLHFLSLKAELEPPSER